MEDEWVTQEEWEADDHEVADDGDGNDDDGPRIAEISEPEGRGRIILQDHRQQRWGCELSTGVAACWAHPSFIHLQRLYSDLLRVRRKH